MKIERISFNNRCAPCYSDAIIVNDHLICLSGLCSVDIDTWELRTGDITSETKTVLDNLESILKKLGSGMDQVIECSIYLADMADAPEMNREYVKHFDPHALPVRLCIGNAGLAEGFKIELFAKALREKAD